MQTALLWPSYLPPQLRSKQPLPMRSAWPLVVGHEPIRFLRRNLFMLTGELGMAIFNTIQLALGLGNYSRFIRPAGIRVFSGPTRVSMRRVKFKGGVVGVRL